MRKSNLVPYQIITAASMGANVTSAVTNIQYLDNIGIQLNWSGLSGSAIGTFYVQVSVDYEEDYLGNVVNAGNWVNLAISPVIVAASDNNSAYIDVNQIGAPYIRVYYSRTSGTGTLDAFVTGKMV